MDENKRKTTQKVSSSMHILDSDSLEILMHRPPSNKLVSCQKNIQDKNTYIVQTTINPENMAKKALLYHETLGLKGILAVA